MSCGFGSLGSIQIKRKGEGGKEQNMNICGLKLQYFIRGLLNISQDSHSLFECHKLLLPEIERVFHLAEEMAASA